jgi:diguanylate cyclase (GGDEF)-like protein
MATALPRPTDAPAPSGPWPAGLAPRLRGLVRRGLRARLAGDPFLVYTAALAPIAMLVAFTSGEEVDLPTVGILTTLAIGLQAILGRVPTARRPMTPLGWSLLRLAVSLLYVGGLAELVGGHTHPLLAMYVPVVVAAAALGTSQALVIGAAATMIYLSPELAVSGASADTALRGLTLAGISIVLAIGVRRLVIAVEQTTAKLRSAMVAERRRSRQIAGMEAVSQLLVSGGHTTDLLDGALGVLVDRFHYHYVTVYLLEDGLLQLGAQRGYQEPPQTFDGRAGVIGRVMRLREIAFVPDVSRDPDYIAVYDEVVSEICAPLLDDDRLLGVLNVEARQPLDRTDRDLVATLAGRVATVLALGRDRQALAERAAVFHNLNEFTNAVSGELDLDRLGAAMVEAVRSVVAADIVTLTVLEPGSARYLLRAATDVDPSSLGAEVWPGEGLAGRAIRDRTVVIDPKYEREPVPIPHGAPARRPPLLGAGVPLLRDGAVIGALSILRADLSQRFRPIEREAIDLLAGHAALALSNAFLHAEVGALATHDSLTGLYNRRYFDEALQRIVAAWRRSPPGERRPVAAIMFDLDHFGTFNKLHGHQVGDEVLRTFGGILQARFRDSDLVARFGGEEFACILEGATRDDAVRVADEVRAALSERTVPSSDGSPLKVTVSAGCAELDEAEATAEQLLRTSDVALFMAKRAGRDRVVAA